MLDSYDEENYMVSSREIKNKKISLKPHEKMLKNKNKLSDSAFI